MRICLYTETALPRIGGQQLVVDALARHLQALGHHVTVLTQHPRRPLKADDAALPYPVVRHPRFVSTQHLVGWYRHFLLRLHRREKFDVIHCHSVYPTGWIATLCRDALGVPVVITSHGGDVRAGNARLLKKAPARRSADAVRHADALISMSRFTHDGYLRLDPACAPRITPIPNGVDLAPFATPAPRPATLPDSVVPNQYALFMGRLAHQKGVDVLLEALARLPHLAPSPGTPGEDRGEGPSSILPPPSSPSPGTPGGRQGGSQGVARGVALVVAGEGEEGSALVAQGERLGLKHQILFAGRVSGDLKTYLFQNARFVVLPSRRAEAFPLVVLEAYAAAKPVIGTLIPGLQDIVLPHQTGLLVPEQSPDALAAALYTLFSDDALCQSMGAEATKIAQSHSWQSIAQRHIDLFAHLRQTPR